MVGVEIDGYHWLLHGKNLDRDQRKKEALGNALHLIRLRDDRLPPMSVNDLAMNSKEPYKSIVNKVLTELLPFPPDKKQRIQEYVANKNFHNSTEYLRLPQRTLLTVPLNWGSMLVISRGTVCLEGQNFSFACCNFSTNTRGVLACK